MARISVKKYRCTIKGCENPAICGVQGRWACEKHVRQLADSELRCLKPVINQWDKLKEKRIESNS